MRSFARQFAHANLFVGLVLVALIDVAFGDNSTESASAPASPVLSPPPTQVSSQHESGITDNVLLYLATVGILAAALYTLVLGVRSRCLLQHDDSVHNRPNARSRSASTGGSVYELPVSRRELDCIMTNLERDARPPCSWNVFQRDLSTAFSPATAEECTG